MERNLFMQVVGNTTQQYVFVASKARKFRMNEILVIEDSDLCYPKGEVVETQSFNKYIPLTSEKNSMVDNSVLQSLKEIGFTVDEGEINLAKVRLVIECPYAVKTGVNVRLPEFNEVKSLLVKKSPKEGLVLGILKNTEEIAKTMPDELKNIAPTFSQETKTVLEQDSVPFIFDIKSMDQYPHVGIFGGSGSGKSYCLRTFSEELLIKRIPCIIIDPHFEMSFSAEFPGLPQYFRSNFSNKYTILTVGKDLGIQFTDLTANDLIIILTSVSDVSEAMESVLKMIHKKKDSYFSFSQRLEDLIYILDNYNSVQKNLSQGGLEDKEREVAQRQINLYNEYATKITNSSTLVGISWRLNRLYYENIFTTGIDKITECLLGRKSVVLQGSLWSLQVISGYVISKMYEKRRLYRDSIQRGENAKEKFPPFVIIVDEAHNFAPKGDMKTATKKELRIIAQEGRKYGVFIVPATQRPSLLDETITAQLNTKFVFRTVRSSDIQLIREETDISTEDANRLPYLQSGDCFVSSAITGRTLSVRIRVAKTVTPHNDNPFSELEEMFTSDNRDILLAISPLCPITPPNILNILQKVNLKLSKSMDLFEFNNILSNLADEGLIIEKDTPLGSKFDIVPN